jgi:hypothetical protein
MLPLGNRHRLNLGPSEHLCEVVSQKNLRKSFLRQGLVFSYQVKKKAFPTLAARFINISPHGMILPDSLPSLYEGKGEFPV